MKPSPRVLHVIHSGAIGGGPQVVLNLVSHVTAHHTVAAPDDGPLLRDAAAAGAETMQLRRTGEFSFALSIPLLARTVRAFDLIHLHGQFAGFYGSLAALFGRVPTVYTAHFPSFVTDRNASTRVRNHIAELVPGRLARHVVACSRTSRDEYLQRRLVAEARISCIYNGVTEAPPTRTADAVRVEFGVGPHQPVILALGRLTAQKGFDLLIEAMPYVRCIVPDAVTVIVGDGEMRSELEARAARHQLGNAVRFTGWRRDTRDLFDASNVVAVPSRYDIFPLVPLEAMMAGRAVVATDLPALREAVIDGKTGRLVPFSAADLAAALSELLLDQARRERMEQEARHRARICFGVQTMAAGYERVYAEALA